MLKAMIIDDEIRASDALRLMMVKFIPQISQIAVCNDAREAAELIRTFEPHLVFLDIKMPHLSGFELLRKMPNQHFKVIFTTAFNEFAIKAIRFSAFDYLLKPVDIEELIESVSRYVVVQNDTNGHGDLFQNMIYNINASDDNFRLALPSKAGVHFFEPQQIMYCEALSNYTRFNIDDGKQFVTSKTLGDYEDLLLPHNFIRCHKSFLVNKKFISYVDHDGFIILKNAARLEVSKRRKAEVIKNLSAGSVL